MEKLKEKLKMLGELDGGPEAAHVEADEALLEFINDKEVTELFNDIRKWYA